jgi:hypothetical protein
VLSCRVHTVVGLREALYTPGPYLIEAMLM